MGLFFEISALIILWSQYRVGNYYSFHLAVSILFTIFYLTQTVHLFCFCLVLSFLPLSRKWIVSRKKTLEARNWFYLCVYLDKWQNIYKLLYMLLLWSLIFTYYVCLKCVFDRNYTCIWGITCENVNIQCTLKILPNFFF